MLLRICLGIGGLALLCAFSSHLRQHQRRSTGIVLAAVMLSFQAIVHPPSEQAIAQQFEQEDEQEVEDEEPISLKRQARRHAKRIRSGQHPTSLALRLSTDQLGNHPKNPGRRDGC